jgi:hypothetical protein
MSIALVRPLDMSEELIIAALAGPPLPFAECTRCYTVADLDEDAARGQLDWALTDDGDLVCDDCADADGPAHCWDRAYWG